MQGINIEKILIVGIGGFIGAALRYIISISSTRLLDTNFPLGTLIVNVAGGLLIGLIMELSLTTNFISPTFRLFLTTGILGGLTTFSTFSYETVDMLSKGIYFLGILNASLNLFLSLLGVTIGKYIVRLIG